MKAKIAPRKEIVLLYQSEKIEGSDRLFALLTQMQIPYKEVAASELGQTTGTLAGYRSDPTTLSVSGPQSLVTSVARAAVFGPKASIVRGKRVEESSSDEFVEPQGVWPSDHKGVWVELRLGKNV